MKKIKLFGFGIVLGACLLYSTPSEAKYQTNYINAQGHLIIVTHYTLLGFDIYSTEQDMGAYVYGEAIPRN